MGHITFSKNQQMRTKLWSEVKERVLVAGPAVNDRMTKMDGRETAC